MKLTLFFTWDVSLKLWKDRGLLEREVKFYEQLAARGVEVTFLTWGGADDAAIASELKHIKTIPLYTRMPCPKSKALRLLLSPYAAWVARKEIKKSHLLKTNQMWGGWVVALASWYYRKPLIARCGFELYQFTVKQNHNFPRRAFIWLISKITYSRAKLIVVATPEDKEFVTIHFDQKPEKIIIQPNWIDANLFAPQIVAQKDNHILYVGRLTKQKNVAALIDALSGTNYTLDIIGDGELRGELETRAREKNARVNFLGNVPNHLLPAIYSVYPLFVLPSLYEGNPKTLLEAMSCGMAVLGTNVPGIASLIKQDETGFLAEPTPGALRDAINKLMNYKETRERLGKAARQQIITTQTLDRLVAQELASYQSLTGRKI